MAIGVTVHLNQFEGPLGLLLFLIRKEEMDIMDINIGQITDQYLAYIKNMGSLDLENAGEFVAMAATLIHIKSKMLLPNYQEDEDEVIEDPRKELVQKLLEYQVFKEASGKLYDRSLLNRDVWIKGAKEPIPDLPDDNIEVDENPLFSLILSYRKAVKRVKKAVHHVTGKMQSIASRILELKEYLQPGGWSGFFEIMDITRSKLKAEPASEEYVNNLDGPMKTKLLITFLSLLELGKIGFVRLFQSETYGDIHIETLQSIERDVISHVEEYETLDAAENADQIFEKISLQVSLADDDGDEESEFEMSATDEEIENAEKTLALEEQKQQQGHHEEEDQQQQPLNELES